MARSAAAKLPDPGLVAPPQSRPAMPVDLVRVDDLSVRFVSRDLDVSVINGVSFALAKGEVLCLLGESGSGKSVTLRALMRLLPPTARIGGRMVVDGRDVAALSDAEMQAMRGPTAAMIFQEPMTALDPVFTIGQQIAEMIVAHQAVSWAKAEARALELLELVQVPSAKRRLAAYPHELSGGLRQRAMIALALSCSPKLLLADEPTTALDATVQIQVLLLLRELQRELGMTTIFVTHDLGVAAEIADRIGVMYAGRLVELGDVVDVIERPRHPYTEGLLRSTVHGSMRGQVLDAIPGSPPDLTHLPPGCSFAPRCRYVRQVCLGGVPPLHEVGPAHRARCHRHLPHGAFMSSPELPE